MPPDEKSPAPSGKGNRAWEGIVGKLDSSDTKLPPQTFQQPRAVRWIAGRFGVALPVAIVIAAASGLGARP